MAIRNEGHCPSCSALVSDGRAGCQSLYDELAARAYSDLQYAAVQTLAFDTYCMQHPDKYCRSAKSYAAHLMRLCCGVEYQGDTKTYEAIQRWLNGYVEIAKPPVLSHLGQLTVAEVSLAHDADDYAQQVHAWAKNVWAAYSSQQELARAWIQAALNHQKPNHNQNMC